MNFMQPVVTAYHILVSLANDLYEDVGQCLMELVRNGMVASMPNPNHWSPKLAKIEIILVRHPLCNGKHALMIVDHGCGLTTKRVKHYFEEIGPTLDRLRKHQHGSHGGASQKGIGRFATLALNEVCQDRKVPIPERAKHGYWLYSRSEKSGPVRFVHVTPEAMEEGRIKPENFIAPDAHEMGPLRNIEGTFTAIVIPTPVFTNHEEIYEAIKWRLPREADKMPDLRIGGKKVEPPPLEGKISLSSKEDDGRSRARIGIDPQGGGMWLCDEATGLRVASCRSLGRKLPEPLFFPELVGDIFLPNLLDKQNTARSTLVEDFARKGVPAWDSIMMFLIREVVPAANTLIKRDAIVGDAAKSLDELAELFKNRYGEPEKPEKKTRKKREPVVKDPNAVEPEPEPETKDDDEENDPKVKRYRRTVSINFRGKTYRLYRGRTLSDYVFAEVNLSDPTEIWVNIRGGYKAMPKGQQARLEHILMQVLYVIGMYEERDAPSAVLFATQARAELLGQ